MRVTLLLTENQQSCYNHVKTQQISLTDLAFSVVYSSDSDFIFYESITDNHDQNSCSDLTIFD